MSALFMWFINFPHPRKLCPLSRPSGGRTSHYARVHAHSLCVRRYCSLRDPYPRAKPENFCPPLPAKRLKLLLERPIPRFLWFPKRYRKIRNGRSFLKFIICPRQTYDLLERTKGSYISIMTKIESKDVSL